MRHLVYHSFSPLFDEDRPGRQDGRMLERLNNSARVESLNKDSFSFWRRFLNIHYASQANLENENDRLSIQLLITPHTHIEPTEWYTSRFPTVYIHR